MLLVTGIRDVLIVRSIRNSCYEYLTGNVRPIGVLSQIRWYYTQYLNLVRSSQYRLFLFRSDQGIAIGYGALRVSGKRLLVTECVRERYRGQGYGAKILQAMINVAHSEKRDIVAEIWTDNVASIALHERAGFVPASSRFKAGRELVTYILRDGEV